MGLQELSEDLSSKLDENILNLRELFEILRLGQYLEADLHPLLVVFVTRHVPLA